MIFSSSVVHEDYADKSDMHFGEAEVLSKNW
jgi:hypothetical protein